VCIKAIEKICHAFVFPVPLFIKGDKRLDNPVDSPVPERQNRGKQKSRLFILPLIFKKGPYVKKGAPVVFNISIDSDDAPL
jgi:hypothetical protein